MARRGAPWTLVLALACGGCGRGCGGYDDADAGPCVGVRYDCVELRPADGLCNAASTAPARCTAVGFQCPPGFIPRAECHWPLPDAGADAHDAAPDAPDAALPTTHLFQHCMTARDCGGAPYTCDISYPGGLCTRSCTRDGNCLGGPAEITPRCAPTANGAMECLPGCTLGEGDCGAPGPDGVAGGFGGVCLGFDPSDDTVRACYPACGSMGAPMCVDSQPCEPYSRECGGAPPVPAGADNGAPCARDEDCKSAHCITETDATMPGAPQPTGFLDGYCVSVAVQVPDSQYVMGEPVPQNGCPPGSATIPQRGEHPSDPTMCWKTCDAVSDCRAGYTCEHFQTVLPDGGAGGDYFADGICLPIDCSQPGQTCPTGHSCRSVVNPDGTFHVCASITGPMDGGSSDAAPGD